MKLTVTIQMDNAAFGESNRYTEVRLILARVTSGHLILDTPDHLILRDSNGNTVGRAEVSE